jgi:CheY-like chemotaxis protein
MQGTISVESRKGHGSSFTVSFPRLMIEKTEYPPEDGLMEERKEKEQAPGLRVLAVDDFAPMRFLLTRYLQEIREVSDFDVAESDSDALALAAVNQYDVVLMDINLKCQRDGEQVMNEMRRLPSYATVPFVAVTAYALNEDRERYLASGFADYLAKPVKQEQVRSTLLSSLGIRDFPRPVRVQSGTASADLERFMGQKAAS